MTRPVPYKAALASSLNFETPSRTYHTPTGTHLITKYALIATAVKHQLEKGRAST